MVWYSTILFSVQCIYNIYQWQITVAQKIIHQYCFLTDLVRILLRVVGIYLSYSARMNAAKNKLVDQSNTFMRRWRCAWLSWVALDNSPSQHSTSSRKTGTSQLPEQLSQQVLSSCLGKHQVNCTCKSSRKQTTGYNMQLTGLDSFCKR